MDIMVFIWLKKDLDHNVIVYFERYDPDNSFLSEYNLQTNRCTVLVANYGDNVW